MNVITQSQSSGGVNHHPWVDADAMSCRLSLAAFLMGTANNLTFVVSNASATNLMPVNVGIVYMVNILPELLLKGSAPLWFQRSGYRIKFVIAGLCFVANMVLINAGLDLSTGWLLLGVAMADLGGGMGEASMLALSQSYTAPRTVLNAWSSGTGAAGVLGYLLSMYALPYFGTAGKLSFAASLLVVYWGTYFCLLPRADRDTTAQISAPEDPLLITDAGGVPAVVCGEEPPTVTANAHGCCQDDNYLQQQLRATRQPPSTVPLSSAERLVLLRRLLPYVLPLIIVYWSEYAIQSGAWTAFALGGPLASPAARTAAYQQLNLFYQVGVLISRSAGRLCTLSVLQLWVAAWLQVGMLVLFIADGAFQLWVGPSLVAPALVVGLLGGTVYVQSMLAIDRKLPRRMRELALATVSVGSPVGILLADASGLLVQWCLFRYHGLPIGDGWCPFATNATAQGQEFYF